MKDVLRFNLVGLLTTLVALLILNAETSPDRSFVNDYGTTVLILLVVLLLFAVSVLVSFVIVKITERRLYTGRP